MFTHSYNYSVIIPHKNCVPLLLRCVHSIPDRDDIQIIIVDDVSTLSVDEREKMEKLCSSRVRVLFLEKSQYAGGARNVGMEMAEGRWLVFADSDDFFTKDAFGEMDKWVDSECDMVFFCHEARFSDTMAGTTRSNERNLYVQRFASNVEDGVAVDVLRYYNPVPWARMVRRDFVQSNNLLFDCVRASNDAMFALRAGLCAQSIAADSHVTYCVTVRNGSLTRTPSQEIADCRYQVIERLYRLMYDNNLNHMLPWLARNVWTTLRHRGIKEFVRYYRLARAYHANIWKSLMLCLRH